MNEETRTVVIYGDPTTVLKALGLTHGTVHTVTATPPASAAPKPAHAAPAATATPAATPAPATVAGKLNGGGAKRGGRGQKRDPGEMDALIERVHEYVSANPASKIEKVKKALGVDTKDLALPVKKLLAAGRITSKGQRRATSYTAVAASAAN